MFKKKKINTKSYYGFTLVEMLIVIAIITVLAGASLFAMQGSRESARDARRKADLETIRSGLELYRSDCNDYPLAASVVFAGTDDLLGDGTPTVCLATNVYIDDIPQDSTSGRTYRYTQLTSTTYELCAALETETTAVAGCGNPGGCTENCTYRVTNP
jgi:prepilin-type N-terminal cleavage/methylation domain-containing protein